MQKARRYLTDFYNVTDHVAGNVIGKVSGNVAGKVAGKEMRLILAVRGMLENSLEFFDTSWNVEGG